MYTEKTDTKIRKEKEMKSIQEFKKEHSIQKEIASFTKTDISKVLIPHIKTGIKELDELLGGGLTAGVIMLGGHSSMGKIYPGTSDCRKYLSTKDSCILLFSGNVQDFDHSKITGKTDLSTNGWADEHHIKRTTV